MNRVSSTCRRRNDLNDIPTRDWVARWLPARWQPYARLCRIDRPIGIWLTLLPTLAGVTLAADGHPTLLRLSIFALGAAIMRGAGCTINDMFDRDFDGRVERTRLRPLASGQMSLRQASYFLLVQLLAAAALLGFLNQLSVGLAIALLPIVVVYPLCKRFTYWPQAVLGMAFNWGILMAWADTTGSVGIEGVLVWLGAVAWQLGYDTVYAYVDREDDRKIGLHSTALRFGDSGRGWIAAFYAIALLLWILAGTLITPACGYYLMMTLIAIHFSWQLAKFDVSCPERGIPLFRSNTWVGIALLLGAFAAGY